MEVHVGHDEGLQAETLVALGAEVALVGGLIVNARLHEGGGYPVGGGRGVAVHEAAGVGGHGHIEGQGRLQPKLAQLPHHVVHQLAAGSPGRVHAAFFGKALVGGVVVKGKVDAPLQPSLPPGGEQSPPGDVHRHHHVRLRLVGGQIGLQIGGKQVGGVLVG